MKVKYDGENLTVWFGRYSDGNNVIRLMDDHDAPYATVSINVDANLKDNEVAIKEYDGQDDIVDALVMAEVIKAPHRYCQAGFVQVPICYLTDKSLEEM